MATAIKKFFKKKGSRSGHESDDQPKTPTSSRVSGETFESAAENQPAITQIATSSPDETQPAGSQPAVSTVVAQVTALSSTTIPASTPIGTQSTAGPSVATQSTSTHPGVEKASATKEAQQPERKRKVPAPGESSMPMSHPPSPTPAGDDAHAALKRKVQNVEVLKEGIYEVRLDERLPEKDQEIGLLRNQLWQTREQRDKLDKELSEANHELAKRTTEMQALEKKHKSELDHAVQNQKEVLTVQILQLKKEIEDSKEEKSRAGQREAEVKSELENVKKQTDNFKQQKEKVESKVKDLQAQLEDVTVMVGELQAENKSLHQKLIDRDSESDATATQLKKLNEDKQRITAELQQTQAVRNKIAQTSEEHDKEYEQKMKALTDELNTTKKSCTKTQAELESTITALKEREKDLTAVNEKIIVLTTQLNDAQAATQEATDKEQTASNALKTFQSKLKALVDRLEKRKGGEAKRKPKQDAIDELLIMVEQNLEYLHTSVAETDTTQGPSAKASPREEETKKKAARLTKDQKGKGEEQTIGSDKERKETPAAPMQDQGTSTQPDTSLPPPPRLTRVSKARPTSSHFIGTKFFSSSPRERLPSGQTFGTVPLTEQEEERVSPQWKVEGQERPWYDQRLTLDLDAGNEMEKGLLRT
ncbi:uncharacterized protein SPPG_04550 [Spizellomyces punctatus DAOM BR117]|uniref:Uncharacterized protein n=1 Tax=Spizellomyces punctatus (strain DAOM BR117) TaxID=645134 RepID=A0A0L0HH59_SPIPD|nr:uncharacterized protein SPPG_04550 [Spizellomyces punctatus DAOM BR117]KND00215.1 hypothetical protein SPPG_04550 [Spizellomyces punctatus DAOM BR117]|eukprot:XP_016608254.1 hypothetical protein SPPG_04550 [Spizellomyces punctatus DAOM BR117]